MNIRKLKNKIYNMLLGGNPIIKREYDRYLSTHGNRISFIVKAIKMIELNWKYVVLKKNPDKNLDRMVMPESSSTSLASVDDMVKKLKCYDVISFDVFDTLIFRAVEKPTDVFRILEAEWNIIGFAKMRQEAERQVRGLKSEATIYDIYQILSKHLGIDIEEGIRLELEVEQKVCFANPYMFKIYKQLKETGKTIIAVSDMYIPQKNLVALLNSCGYDLLDDVYVSCEYNASKGNGALQTIVKHRLGDEKKYIHIGDNKKADIDGSKSAGWDAYYYPNICTEGAPYRRYSMKSLASAFYKGIVNYKMHGEEKKQDAYYEYGFVYGGIITVGYCQFLERLCKQENIDQFIFVARDGFIVQKIYDHYFSSVDHEYVPFSRFASYELTMERNWKKFLENIVLPYTYSSKKETVESILEICDMMYLERYQAEYHLNLKDVFGKKQYGIIEHIFEDNIDEIILNYSSAVEAGNAFFERIIGTHKKICIVDVGWQGTGAICLKYFLEEKCGLGVEVCGALMGTVDNDAAEIALSSGRLFSYMFSPHHNSDMQQKHTGRSCNSDYRNLLMEIMFTDVNPTFIKFEKEKDGSIGFCYGPKENNEEMIQSIQRGINDFAEEYFKYQRKFGRLLDICGQEAYMPFDAIAEARKCVLKVLGRYEVNTNTGILDKSQEITFREVVK